MSINKNQLSLASALALMNLSLLGGCGNQSTPVAQSSTQTSTPAEDDRAWLTRWGDYNMGTWTTDQLLADCANGRHATTTLARNPELDAWKPLGELWRNRVRPTVGQALQLRGGFGPGATFITEGLRHALVLDARDAIARSDDESALQALECLGSLGRQSTIGLAPSYSEEMRAYDRKNKDESMTWQEHEDITLKQGAVVLAHINGVLSTWNDWRSMPGATDRLAASLDWVDLEALDRLYQASGTRPIRGNRPGWTVEDRA
jgi:hypothetical protein